MVGFTLPLTLFASTAAKSFMEIEKQVIRIRRVYGDFSTTVAETDKMIDSIKTLAGEYTKYGVAVSDTLGLAAEAAAAGKSGQELLAQISQATRLAVLGNVEQTQALETTMSVTNAFGVATEDLAGKIDFLNAVENQSVTSIEDLTIAIPKAGPVVQQLGGDVEDLAFFLTAMKEGGINASEGANALKSGLAALINPTGKAKEMLSGFGINIEKIVNSNKGDIQGLVIDFASALDTLDPLSRARAIEQLFGKFQFSRLSTLFQNVIGEGTQASRVLELTKATTQELAILSQRELKKVEDTTTYKFEKAFADFQAALAPVGEQFLKAITPVIEFGTKLLNQFNNMSDGAKSFAVILTTVVAGVGPVLLMTVGLVANGVANLIKMFQALGSIFNKSGADTTTLGLQTEYMTQQQLEAAAVAASLNQSHSKLTQVFSVEAAALNNLTLAYQKAVTAQRGFAMPGGRVAGSATKPKTYASGVVSVPGPKGKGDVVPAMLSPGEAVIPAKMAKKYGGLINGMIAGNIPGYEDGVGVNKSTTQSGLQRGHIAPRLDITSGAGKDLFDKSPFAKLEKSLQGFATVVGNLVADMSTSMNQRLKSKGMSSADFQGEWDSRTGRLLGSAKAAGLDIQDPKMTAALDDLQQQIGQRAVQLGKGTVTDAAVERATTEVLAKAQKLGGAHAAAALALQKLADQAGAVRFNLGVEEARTRLASGKAKVQDPSAAASGKETYLLDSKTGTKIGRVKLNPDGTIRDYRTPDQYDASGNYKKKGETLSRLRNPIPIPITRGEKAAETRKRNAEARAVVAQEAQAKRDAYNARRREQYAAKKAASAPAPKKPGIGSRIAAGVKGMGGMGAGMGLAMAGGMVGSMVPGLEGVGIAASIAGSALMMFPGPVGIVIAALTGLVGVAMSLNAAQEQQRQKAIELANASTMSQASLEQMSKDFGTVSLTEARKSEQDARLLKVTEEQLTAGQQYLKEMESGQKLLAGVQAQQAAGVSTFEISQNIASNLANAVAQKVITREQGAEIIAALGSASGNFGISSSAGSQFESYIKDPAKTGIISAQQNLETINLGFEKAMNAPKYRDFLGSIGAMTTELALGARGGGGGAVSRQYLMNPLTMNAGNRNDVRQISTRAINAYGQAQSSADVINSTYDQKIAEAKTQKEKNSLEAQRTIDLDAQRKAANEIYNKIRETKVALADADFSDTFMASVKTTFGENSEAATTAQNINDLGNSTFKTRIQAQLLSGTVNPQTIETMIQYSKNNEDFGSNYNLAITKQGEQATLDLISYAQYAGGTEETVNLLVKAYSTMDPETARLVGLGVQGVASVGVNINGIDEDKLKVLGSLVEKIGDKKEVSLDFIRTEAGNQVYNDWKTVLNNKKMTASLFIKVMAIGDIGILREYLKAKGIVTKSGGLTRSADDLSRTAKADQLAARRLAIQQDRITNPGGDITPPAAPPTGGGGGSTASTEDPIMARLQKRLAKQNALLNIISLKEAKINKRFDERKKVLEEISKLNGKIAEQQRGQLDVADALTRGDIASAARAVQAERVRAAALAHEQQMLSLERQRQAELANVTVKGKTRGEIESKIDRLNRKIARREYRFASSGGMIQGYASGGRVRMAHLSKKGKSFDIYGQTFASSGGMMKGYSVGGKVMSYFADGGSPLGSDTIPAMLTPGEFVIKRPAVQNFGVKNLEAINSGSNPSSGVYNYSISVNVSTEANPDQIARAVAQNVRRTESYRIRGNKL
jgi:TP901 family phage tail tape measure protein